MRLNTDEFSPHHTILLQYIIIFSSLYASPFRTVCILQLLYQNPQYKLLVFIPVSVRFIVDIVQMELQQVGALRQWGSGTVGQWDCGSVGYLL